METEQDRLAIMRWETETGPTTGKNKRPGTRAIAKIVAEPVKPAGKRGISQGKLQKIPVVNAKPANARPSGAQTMMPNRGTAKPTSAIKPLMPAQTGRANAAGTRIAGGRTGVNTTGIATKNVAPAAAGKSGAKPFVAIAKAGKTGPKRTRGTSRD